MGTNSTSPPSSEPSAQSGPASEDSPLRAELQRLREVNADLAAELRRLEFDFLGSFYVCGAERVAGHRPGCTLGAALARTIVKEGQESSSAAKGG